MVNLLKLSMIVINAISVICLGSVIVIVFTFLRDIMQSWNREPENAYAAGMICILALAALMCSVLNLRSASSMRRSKCLPIINLFVGALFISVGFADLSSEVSDSRWFFLASAPYAITLVIILTLWSSMPKGGRRAGVKSI